MKDNVLTFLAVETNLGGIDLDFPVEPDIYQRKRNGICLIILKRVWEELMLAAPTVAAGGSMAASRNASF